MPISNVEVNALAAALREPLSSKYEIAIEILDQHVRSRLGSIYKGGSKLKVTQTIKAGSLFKETAMRNRFDVDLVFLVRMDAFDFCLNSTQASLKAALLDCLEEQKDVEFDREQFQSNPFPFAKCKLYGMEFDVLVGVSLAPGKPTEEWAYRQLEAVQDVVLNNYGYQKAVKVAHALSASCSYSSVVAVKNQTETVKKAIVLLKFWRDFWKLSQFKSFFVELIAMSVAEELRREVGKNVTIRKILKRSFGILDLSDCTAKEPRMLLLDHLSFYEPNTWSEWIPKAEAMWHGHRLVLVNPMTPILDALFSVSTSSLIAWSNAAKESLSILTDPQMCVNDLFGVCAADVEKQSIGHLMLAANVMLPKQKRQ
eukprot:TRINITY_DN44384_c0_g1_i1.p1 TRINITY_DN44384_c0_g1~~TRINITY_DN44384_c0_g1_i1.p1  ORF type:complete len:369 (-),score=53.48 TRINITY_DN44384_c0_g1_i1:291-1397(-)